MQTKHMNFPLELKSIAEDGMFSGYASVFNIVDNQNDIVLSGAFNTSINSNPGEIKLLWQHQSDQPIGVITKIAEDNFGLYIEGQLLLDIQQGQEAYSLLKSGAIDGLSIGYTAVEAELDYETGVRLLKEVNLWEVSLVTFPANPMAVVGAVKSLPATTREFENFLREAGYSRRAAKSIALRGFEHFPNRRDAGGEGEYEFSELLEKVVANLTEN